MNGEKNKTIICWLTNAAFCSSICSEIQSAWRETVLVVILLFELNFFKLANFCGMKSSYHSCKLSLLRKVDKNINRVRKLNNSIRKQLWKKCVVRMSWKDSEIRTQQSKIVLNYTYFKIILAWISYLLKQIFVVHCNDKRIFVNYKNTLADGS